MEYWESLTYLTELCLYHCSRFADEGIVWIGKLVALRVFDLHGCCRLTDVGVHFIGTVDVCHRTWMSVIESQTGA